MVSFFNVFDKIKNNYFVSFEKEAYICQLIYQNKYFFIYLIIFLHCSIQLLGIEGFSVEDTAVSQGCPCLFLYPNMNCRLKLAYLVLCLRECVWTIRRFSQKQSCPPDLPLVLYASSESFPECRNREWVR